MAMPLPQLPLEMVEHIQSFMGYRDATRTGTICTRLYNSWYERKQIDLDEDWFTSPKVFRRVGRDIIRRYKAGNLKLKKFTVRMVTPGHRKRFTKMVLVGAVRLGAVEIHIILDDNLFAYRIPHGVFTEGKLEKLTVVGGALNICEKLPTVCSSIKLLSLLPDRFTEQAGDLIQNYLVRCPKLEVLVCRGALIRFDCWKLGPRLHNLPSLIVDTITCDDEFWVTRMIPRLPRPRTLFVRSLPECTCRGGLLIVSNSLEMISIEDRRSQVDIVFRVPKLRVFNFHGCPGSTLIFKSSLNGVISIINVVPHRDGEKWLVELHSLLHVLSASTIFLEVMRPRHAVLDTIPCTNATRAFPRTDVELLDVSQLAMSPWIEAALLTVCRPMVTRYNNA